MKLEAVVICINYADFLSITLPNNKSFFDKIVVVTDTQDTETARVCEFNNVECIKTDVFYTKKGSKPNKAKGINEGLKYLNKDAWVLHLDADIWLPALTRHNLDNYPLDPTCLYGIDRLMCDSFMDWMKYFYSGKPVNEGWCYTHLDAFPVGTRLVKYHSEGYIPIGFFQLWNPSVSKITHYPEQNAAFDRTDTLFAQLFPKKSRRFIPDFAVIHLASEDTYQGQNWQGRISKPFRPLTFWQNIKYRWMKFKFNLKNAFNCECPDSYKQ
jgi:hypothetical protein